MTGATVKVLLNPTTLNLHPCLVLIRCSIRRCLYLLATIVDLLLPSIVTVSLCSTKVLIPRPHPNLLSTHQEHLPLTLLVLTPQILYSRDETLIDHINNSEE